MKKILLFLISIVFLFVLSSWNKEKNDDLVSYLKSNGMSPEEYVLSKFQDHDYVLLGEYHRIKHDVELVLNLIPKLYESGINNLCIEFGNYEDQYLVDSLLALPYFDRELAKKIIFNSGPFWGYTEYIDIYKVAWEVNQSGNKEKFRVINICPLYDPCKKGGARVDADPDSLMADVILKTVIEKKEKALIYSGGHHAFTKYHQPIYNTKKGSLLGYETKRMGNIIYNHVGERAFNISLHSPWRTKSDKPVLPVNGIIDSVMQTLGNKPVGFDVVDTPFGKLESNDSYYALGYPDFTLDKYCDGYIFQKALRDYEPVTVEPVFYNEENIGRVRAYCKCKGFDPELCDSFTPEKANKEELSKEDVRNHWKGLIDRNYEPKRE